MARIDEELRSFVREALARSASREQIKEVLGNAGWTPEQTSHALDAYAEVAFELPVPRPKPSASAQEAFLYLVLFTTLLLVAYNLGAVIFQLIERAFPDPVDTVMTEEGLTNQLRWSVSTLIVAFPVFVYISQHIGRALRKDPTKRASAVRKWLTYATLFIAASVLMGDLSTLVFNLLGGELTVRFLLKVATVGIIAGAVFGYYLWDLRKEEQET
jgi:hypothetical protein